jgi:hypothetical protein
VHLSPNRDALAFLFTASAACSLPFSALRAVAQPFRDEHDDTLGLVPPELADRCVVLVFGMLPEEDFALERARAAGAGKVEENNPVADAVGDYVCTCETSNNAFRRTHAFLSILYIRCIFIFIHLICTAHTSSPGV